MNKSLFYSSLALSTAVFTLGAITTIKVIKSKKCNYKHNVGIEYDFNDIQATPQDSCERTDCNYPLCYCNSNKN